MNRLSLFRELRRHRKLAERRSLNLEQNKAARFMVWFMTGFVLVYLAGFAILLALLANGSDTVTAVELICGIMPFVLAFDFLVRFLAQQTPAQMVKPYTLLPIYKYACIDHFIATSLLSLGNLTWFVVLVPYALMAVVFSHGLAVTLGMLFFWWLLILANSQWYSIVRTLINDHLAWWLLPVAFYAVVCLPWYISGHPRIEHMFEAYAAAGTAIELHHPWPYLAAIAILAAMTAINRKIQHAHVWKELSRIDETHLKHISHFSFLDKYGEVGAFLQLEIKGSLRNKNPRKTFIFATAIVLLFSMVIAFTEVYDSPFMQNWWCLYNFAIYGAMMLVKVMCNEGNYIDCLMVRKENILSLLRAKYIFYSALLLLPFLLMLPPVFKGKFSLLMLVAYGLFTAGFQYFILFQMAVYNKQAVPLNTKFISKSGMENNYTQMVAEIACMTLPMALLSTLQLFMGDTLSYCAMSAIGLAFIATHRLWLRNIYRRMMARSYENMEAFRATRSSGI